MRLAGADRRFTGSHERGSGDPSALPITQWFNDTVPRISADEWRLTLRPAPDRVEVIDYETLVKPGERLATVLDCTGGWWSEQEWGGIGLDRLLAEATGNSLLVTSATGYQRRFPLGDADRLFLATEVGGEPLSAGHGFPARLVAPDRRGFWWVKWVTAIEASDRAWWWQAPFPLS